MDECKCVTGHCRHWSDCAVHNEPDTPNGPCDCGGLSGDETEARWWRRWILNHPGSSFWLLISAAFSVSVLLAGCAGKPVIETQIVEKPVPVPCEIQMPEECKDAYALDRASTKDDMLTLNRAMRVEIEQRAACEVMLKAAIRGCNKP